MNSLIRSRVPHRLGRWALCLGTLALLSSGISFSKPNAPNRLTLGGVPFVAQRPNYCGPAALSSLLSFWGKPISQTAIAKAVYDRRHNATNGADLLMFARDQGMSAYTCLTSMAGIKACLRLGFPVLVLQDLSTVDHRGHFRVVTGYNDVMRCMLVRDPNYEEIQRMPYAEFDSVWNAFGRWALIVCPKERETALDPSMRNNPVLHLDLGQAYLRRRDPERARVEFETSLELDPGNDEARDMLARIAGPTRSAHR